jgi:hypothetical protein
MVIFPKTRVVDTELTVEDAMKLVVSGGIVAPENLGKSYNVEPTGEPGFPAPYGATDSGSPPQTSPRSGLA